MVQYCRINTTFLPIWNDGGISPCLYHTVQPIFILLFPLFTLFMHYCLKRIYCCCRQERSGSINDRANLIHDGDEEFANVNTNTDVKFVRTGSFQDFPFPKLPTPFLYLFQLLLHIIHIALPLIHILVKVAMCSKIIAGVDILSAVVNWLCWVCGFNALKVERKKSFVKKIRYHSIPMILFWAIALLQEILIFISWDSDKWNLLDSSTNYLQLIMLCLRSAASLVLLVLAFYAPGLYKREYDIPLESKEVVAESSLRQFWYKSKKLWPFIWPRNNWLRLRVLLCILLLITVRVINVYVPLQNKKIVDYLSDKTNKEDPWILIVVYIILSFLQGGGGIGSMGLLNNMRSFLWIKVQQYTSRSVQRQLFEHLHRLSLRWHLQRKTGEVIRMVDRGSTSIESLLSYFLFQILPTIADIIVALFFFGTYFNGWFALIVFVTMSLYIAITIAVTEWRTKYRRDMNAMENITKAVAVDSLLNFETVKYYNNEAYEVIRYNEKIQNYQSAQWMTLMSLNVLNTGQNIIITCGLLVGMLVCGTLVVEQKLTVGDFVLFMSYIRQLYMPLNFFGTYYRLIQAAFIDMENMFDLLDEKVEIIDVDDQAILNVSSGLVEFKDVNFAYEETRQILKGISFTVHPGQTVALVGPSGSGKSTIIRLLFRFYDIQGGSIKIDGQDIKSVTQKSLRQAIGVVPQDTVLFNDTIQYNIGYGAIGSAFTKIKEASSSADIHQKIETFPEGYETIVGERGLKLSGGEKQRVAIARTMLKSPNIVLLDEATSALDTQTERNIQASLNRICINKTSIVVAHRLSTIVGSDQILVLKDGCIVEHGKHHDLLELEGIYSSMWNQQLEEGDNIDLPS